SVRPRDRRGAPGGVEAVARVGSRAHGAHDAVRRGAARHARDLGRCRPQRRVLPRPRRGRVSPRARAGRRAGRGRPLRAARGHALRHLLALPALDLVPRRTTRGVTPPLDVVTGAYGYTGRYLAQPLLETGRTVPTLTANP